MRRPAKHNPELARALDALLKHGTKPAGRWQQPHLAPRGALVWADAPALGSAAQVGGAGPVVASIRRRTVSRVGYVLRVHGWLWKVTPDMGIYRVTNAVPGTKITETPVKAFRTLAAAKAEAQAILGDPGTVPHSGTQRSGQSG